MNSKRVLTHLIKAGRDALHLEKTLHNLGYQETHYFNLYGEISEAMYCLLDENADSFEESETYLAMHDIYSSDEMCAEKLATLIHESHGAEDLKLPETTKEILAEAAARRNVSLDRMINIILSEWAARDLMIKNAFGE